MKVTEALYPARRVLPPHHIKPPHVPWPPRHAAHPPRRVLPLRHIMPTPVPCPASHASLAATIACIRGHACKDKSFSFPFFRFFSDQCYRDPLYAGSESPRLSTP